MKRLVAGLSTVVALSMAAITWVSIGPAGTAASAVTDSAFVWPLRPRPMIVNPYDPPEHDWLPGHRGVDLAGTEGQPVLAAGDGTVVFAGIVAGKPVVSLDHAGGLRTTYEPVDSVVNAGSRVRAGDPIGLLTAGHGNCAEPCLHWGLRRDRTYLDPLALLRMSPIRLKPLDGE